MKVLSVDIILIILLFAGFVLYFTAKKRLRQGNRAGWLKWAEPYVNITRTPPAKAAAPSREVLTALDDLYREFMEETAAIREEMAVLVDELRGQLEMKITDLESLLQVSAAASPERQTPTMAARPIETDIITDTGNDEDEARLTAEEETVHRRFEILDLLVQGFSPSSIASRLGIGVAEVELVEQLMKGPGENM